MLQSRKFVQIALYFGNRNAVCTHAVYPKCVDQTLNLFAKYCTVLEAPNVADSPSVVESPELPNWVKFCENENPSMVESDDEFVLPKVAGWADTKKLNDDHTRDAKHMAVEIIDSDVNRLTEVLRKKIDSPDAMHIALTACDGINLSESLVGKTLQRFSNDWVAAFGFFKWAKNQVGYVHSGNIYDMMVDILGKSRNFERMWALIKEMNEMGGLVSNGTMTNAIRRLSKDQQYDHAIEAFEQFDRFGLVKDISAMNILMDALVKENSVEHARKVFLKHKDRIPPNSHTFNILIHGWCKARKYNEAREVMELMETHGCPPSVVSYTPFIEYHCQEKDFRKVDEVLDEMQQKGCPPNVVTYTIVMLAFGKANDINRSLEIWERMKRNGCAPDANFYGALIFILSKSGRFKDACDLFKNMSNENVSLNVLTYNSMITAACSHSREEYALELLQEMKENSCRPDIKTYAPLLKMCCRKKRMKVLNYLLSDMLQNNVSMDWGTYTLLVIGLCKNGKLEHACSFFEQMILKGKFPSDKTYKLLMEKLKEKSMLKARQQIEKLMSEVRKVHGNKTYQNLGPFC